MILYEVHKNRSEKLSKKREALYQAYLEASQDTQRETDLEDWDGISERN